MNGANGLRAVLHYRASSGLRGMLDAACSALPGLTVQLVDEADTGGFDAALPKMQVLLHVLKPVSAAMIAAAPRLRLIQKIGVGVNTIDLDAARALGVAVCNMPGSNSQAVAEHTLMLMLAALRRVLLLDAATRAGAGWSLAPDALDNCGELAGRCVGLVGFGAVPRKLAPVLLALGARVLHTNRSGAASESWRTLDGLLSEADVVSLHIPLNPDTAGLINAQRLARMKRGAVLVNTARGGLVDEAALLAALRSGHLRAAGLDVLAQEPTSANNPLLALDNVVVTPHVAWLTPETLQRSLGIAVENCRRLTLGAPLLHRVA